MKPVFAIAWLLCIPLAAHAQGKGDVRIYRCTDAAGKQSLRDTPCPKGQAQQTRDMQRPQDAPRKAPPPPSPTPPPTPVAPAPVVYLAPPKPMYECTTPDGNRYTSENDAGNPRWVPLWTLGYPVFGRPPRGSADRGSFRPAPSESASIGRPQQALPTPTSPRPPHGGTSWPAASGGGTWVRDDCAMLPPAETCARLRDRRSEIRRRFFNGMPSERDVLRVEERTINARLDNDCGGH